MYIYGSFHNRAQHYSTTSKSVLIHIQIESREHSESHHQVHVHISLSLFVSYVYAPGYLILY